MKALIPFPLPPGSTAVPVKTLKPGDVFLRVGSDGNTTTDLWELVAVEGNTVKMRDVWEPGDTLSGVDGNLAAVPLPGRFVPDA